jgi:hypothetical protein
MHGPLDAVWAVACPRATPETLPKAKAEVSEEARWQNSRRDKSDFGASMYLSWYELGTPAVGVAL